MGLATEASSGAGQFYVRRTAVGRAESHAPLSFGICRSEGSGANRVLSH